MFFCFIDYVFDVYQLTNIYFKFFDLKNCVPFPNENKP